MKNLLYIFQLFISIIFLLSIYICYYLDNKAINELDVKYGECLNRQNYVNAQLDTAVLNTKENLSNLLSKQRSILENKISKINSVNTEQTELIDNIIQKHNTDHLLFDYLCKNLSDSLSTIDKNLNNLEEKQTNLDLEIQNLIDNKERKTAEYKEKDNESRRSPQDIRNSTSKSKGYPPRQVYRVVGKRCSKCS